jgi:DNA polymerase III epsilon subunit-like protein
MEPSAPILAIIDTETTGLSTDAQVTELAVRAYVHQAGYTSLSGYTMITRAYKVRPLREGWQTTEEWQSAAQIQGKTTSDVEAHTWQLPDVMCDLAELFAEYPVYWIAHNADFDRRLIRQSLGVSANQWWASPWFCTLRLRFGSDSHKLTTVARHFNVETEDSHSALGDTLILDQVLQKYSDANHRDLVYAPVYSKLTALLPHMRLCPVYP